MARIYLSFANADREFAGRVARELVGMGHVVVDGPALGPEPQDIEPTIRASDAVVFLLTPAALASEWVQKELIDADEVGSAVIPVLLEPVELPLFLAAFPSINAAGWSPEEVARAIVARIPAAPEGGEYARGITFPSEEDAPAPPAPRPAAPPPASVPATEPERAPTTGDLAPIPIMPPAQPPVPQSQPPTRMPGAPPVSENVDETVIGRVTDLSGGAAHQARGEQADATISPIEFRAYHANALGVETWNTLLVYTYVGEAVGQIQADAGTFTELGSAPRTAHGRATRVVASGAELTVEPHVDGVAFSPASDTFIWRGGWHRSLFRFRAEAALAEGERSGWVDIFSGPMVPIGRVELSLRFAATFTTAQALPQGRIVTSSIHDRVFISYSHQDREAFRQASDEYARFGITVLSDERLEAGADYERDLGRMIAGAGVFHLLWSPASARSAECRKEWMAALHREPSERFIKPWFWRQPLVAPPPELAQHHISFRYQRLRRKLLKPRTWM